MKSDDFQCKHIDNITKLIKSLDESNVHSLIITSVPGFGKTFSTLKAFEDLGLKRNKDYAYLSSFSTPLGLAQFLHDNKDKKYIVLDDLAELMNRGNSRGLAILKGALWSISKDEDIRVISYKSSHDIKIPERFLLKSKVIIILNDTGKGVHVDAVKDRGFFYDITFSFDEKLAIVKSFSEVYDCADDSIKKEVFDWIEHRITPATKNFSLRTFINLCELAKVNPDDWSELALELIDVDEDICIYLDIQKESKELTTKEIINLFKERSGKSQRTYYRIRDKLK